MAFNNPVHGLKPKWPGKEAHLSDGTGSERAKKEVKLEDWDPMEEDYNDNSFNNYNRGPGSGLLGNNPHQAGDRDVKYTLFVGNIPSEMTEDGLFNLFSQICDIKFTKVIPRKDNTGYGFVEVPSVKDGEEAIRRLNGHKIRGFGLRISFAREKSKHDAPGPRQLTPASQASLDQLSPKAKLTNGAMPKAGGAYSSSTDTDGYMSSGSNGKRKTPELRKVEHRYGNVAKVTSPKGEQSIKSPTSSAPPSKTPLSQPDNPVINSPLQTLLQKMKLPSQNSPGSSKETSRNGSTSKGSPQEGQKVTRSEARGTGEVKSVGAASREIQFEGSSERKTESEELIAKLNAGGLNLNAGGLNLKVKGPEEGEKPPASPKMRPEAIKSPQAAAPQPLLSLSIRGDSLPHKPSDVHQSEVSSVQHPAAAAAVHQSPHQADGSSSSNRGILGAVPRDAALHQGPMSQPHSPSGQGYQHTCANCSQCDLEGHYHQLHHPWNGPYRYSVPQAQYNQSPEGYQVYPYQHSMPLRYTRQYGPDPHGYAPQYGPVPPAGHTHSYRPNLRYGTSRRGTHRGNFHPGDARFHRDYYPSRFKVVPHKSRQDMPNSHPAKPQSKLEDKSETDAEGGSTSATHEAALDHTIKSRKAPAPVAIPNPVGRPSEKYTGKPTAFGNGASRRSSQGGTGSGSDTSASELCMSCNKTGLLCCGRCKGRYCSKECQREHWPTHKNSCRQSSTPDRSPKTSSPKTRSSPKTASSLKKTSSPKGITTTILHRGMEGQFMARNLPFETPDEPEMEVFVTEVDSPSSVWLQIYKERTVVGNLTRTLNATYQGTTNSGEFSCIPKVGGVCAVQYLEDEFYRGEILSIEDNGACSVRLIDFGITDTVMKEGLRKLQDEFLKLPKQALKCFLSGIKSPQSAWSDEAVQKLQSLVKSKKCTVEFKGQGAEGQEIELYGPNDISASVASILVSAGLAQSMHISAQSPSSVQPPSDATPSPPSLGSLADSLAIGEMIEVCVSQVDSPGCFYANVVKFGSDLVEIVQNMDAFYAEMPTKAGFSPKQGELCAARFSLDKCWYRAVVKRVIHSAEKELSVSFIDYGNSDTISLDECRPLEERFASLPKQAVQCKLAGVKPQVGRDWPEDITLAFKEWLATASIANIIVKDKAGDQLVVEVFCTGTEEPDCSFNTVLQVNGFTDDNIESGTNQAAAQASGDTVSTNQKVSVDQPSESRATKQLLDAVIPKTKFEGFITSVNSPLDFYLQVFSREHIEAFRPLMGLLNARYSLQDLTPFTPRVGDFCAVKSSNDNAWYRALILEQVAPESAFKVLFVDYGVEQMASPERITVLEDQFFDTPMFAVHCGLACVRMNSTSNEKLNERAIAYFTEKVRSKQFQVRVVRKEEKKCFVELLYLDGDNNLTTIKQDLITNGLASLLDVTPSSPVMPQSTPDNPEVASIAAVTLPKDFQGNISTVGDRGDLYIQVVSESNFYALAELTEKLNSHYKSTMQRRPHQPSIGEICAAKYSVDKSWYRARVVELCAPEATAEVLFVDFGNTETVSLDGIQKLEGDCLAIPQFCHHCYLSGVSAPSGGREWDSDATDVLRRLVISEDQGTVKGFQVNVTKQDGEDCEVVLHYSTDSGETWSSVNDELIAHFHSPGPSGDHLPANGGLRQPSSPASEGSDQRSGESEEFETLPAGHPLTGSYECVVVVVNNPSEFFIQISTDVELHNALVAELHEHYAEGSVSPHEPKVGELCAARSSDSAWYRARVVEEVAPESALKVMFVDYGNMEVVPLDKISKLEGLFREVPEVSHRLGIHGLTAPSGDKQLLWSEETIKHLKSKLENVYCQVDIVKNDGNIYHVEIFYMSQEDQWVNIKEELKDLGLAEPIRAPPITLPEPVRAPPITSPEAIRTPPITSPEAIRTPPIRLPEPIRAPPITSPVSSPTTSRDGRILSSSLKKLFLPDSAIDVIVNEVVSPQEFYCQMCIHEENQKLLALMTNIQQYATNLPPNTPPYQPAVGDFCLAKFTDQYWYRAEVVKIKRSCQKALVKYIDFGNMEPLPWSQMCAAQEDFADLSIQAIKCGLSGVSLGANSLDENTKKFLQEELCSKGTSFLQATFQDLTADMTSLVQLVEPELERNINQIVAAYLKDAKPTHTPDQPGTQSRTPNGPMVSPKVMTSGASPKVMTPGSSPKVVLPAASPKFTSPGASPKITTGASPKVMTPGSSPKVVLPAASPKFISPGSSPKITTGASPKVMTPGLSPKVVLPAASPKFTSPGASPKITTGASPKVMTPGSSPKVVLPAASPKFTSPGGSQKAQEAKRRETERKKKELEAKIEAQRRQLAEMEKEIASLE